MVSIRAGRKKKHKSKEKKINRKGWILHNNTWTAVACYISICSNYAMWVVQLHFVVDCAESLPQVGLVELKIYCYSKSTAKINIYLWLFIPTCIVSHNFSSIPDFFFLPKQQHKFKSFLTMWPQGEKKSWQILYLILHKHPSSPKQIIFRCITLKLFSKLWEKHL